MSGTTGSRRSTYWWPRRFGCIFALGIAILAPLGCHSIQDRVSGSKPPTTSNALAAESNDSSHVIQVAAVAPVDPKAAPSSNAEPKPVVKADSVVEFMAAPSAIPAALAEFTLDLETALGIARGENPTIALAEEAVRIGLAEQLQARANLLPTLDAGASFNLHRGNLLSAQGVIQKVDRQSLFVGAGASAVGGGTVGFPGVRLYGHLADALFDPAIARQRVTELRLEADARRNDILLEVATGFYSLAGAEARVEAARQSERDYSEVISLTAKFASAGQGREGDAERAKSAGLLLHAETQRAEEDVAVASSELARLLHLDPAVRFHTTTGSVPVQTAMVPLENLEALVQTAVQQRPEVGASAAAIALSETRLHKERVRPLVPFLAVGYSAGDFGGGSDQADSRFGHFNSRTDLDASAIWSLQNLGAGDLAVQRRLRAEVNAARAEHLAVLDRIRREVAEAHTLFAASRREIDVARRRVEEANRAYQADLIRTRNLVERARPIEVLNSLNLLTAARLDLIRVIMESQRASFQLLVALGESP